MLNLISKCARLFYVNLKFDINGSEILRLKVKLLVINSSKCFMASYGLIHMEHIYSII